MTDAAIKKISRYLGWTLVLALLFYVLYLLSDIVIILAISILFAFIFEPFIKRLEKEGFNRLSSTLLIFVAIGFLFYFALSVLIPKFIYQMNQLIDSLHVYSLHDQLEQIEREIYSYLPFFTVGELSKRIEEFISSQIINSFDKIASVLSSIVSVAAIVVIVPFLSFFLLKDSKKIMRGILNVMPNKYFEMSYWILKKVSIQLGRFVRGWIFDAAFVGIACGLGFYLIGIENALPLGVIAGLGHLVPYFGPVIGGIPALIISLIQFGDFSQAPFIIILIAVVYTLDNGFVQPYVFSKSVNMHPIIIILLIISGSQLFGILGMLLAVPTATVVRTATKEIYFAFKNYRIARL
jgi:predicted PurR-regulated permease PerM